MKFPRFNSNPKDKRGMFRPLKDEYTRHINPYTGEVTEKQKFAPTFAYIQYLKLKYEYERMQEIEQLRRSLEYQEEHYGEVDEVDLTRYQMMLGIKVTR